MARRFEHSGSGRFWTITLDLRAITVVWGKLGTHGQNRRILHDSNEEATAKYLDLVDTQLDEGYIEVADVQSIVWALQSTNSELLRFEHSDGRYVEVLVDSNHVHTCAGARNSDDEETQKFEQATWNETLERVRVVVGGIASRGFLLAEAEPKPATPLVARAHDPQLAAQCRAHPEDPEPWQVYADWLMQHGDVRGELAALLANGVALKAETLLRSHRALLFGSAEAADISTIHWRHGFAHQARVALQWNVREAGRMPPLAATFLASPLAETIDHLELHVTVAPDFLPVMDVLAASPIARTLRALAVTGTFPPFDAARRWSQLALEDLTIVGWTMPMPSLVRLSCGVHDVADVSNEQWPRLEQLQIDFRGYEEQTLVVPAIEALDAATGLPAVRELALLALPSVEGAVRVLATSSIVKQLRTLKVSGHTVARTARTLLARADAFAHLERLELDFLQGPDDVRAKLRVRLPNLALRFDRDAT